MKKQTRTFLGSIVAVIAILVIVLAIYIADLTAFPGIVRETESMRQVKTDGVKSTFHQGLFATYAPKSYAMKPALPEYALYAGMASYYKKNVDQAVSILNNIDPSQLTPEQELYRLSVLEKVFVGREVEKADYYKRQKQAIIDATSVQAYYDSSIKPLVEALK
jgi:hypothetical protein